MSASVERFVDANGLRLRAVAEGEGPPVLILHGFTGDAESMESVSHGLAEFFETLRLELVGHGGSDAPEDIGPYRMAACVEQIIQSANALCAARPHLVGYSMGGRAALAAAIESPKAFDRIVLIGASAGIADAAARREREEADSALADQIERRGLSRFVDDWMAKPIFASQSRLGAEALAQARRQRMRNRPHGLANSLRGMGTGAQPPLYDRLAELERPVLLVVGEEDAKFQGIAESLASSLPDARIARLPGAGHAAHLEAPDVFADVVHDFLSQSHAAKAPDTGSGAQPEGDRA